MLTFEQWVEKYKPVYNMFDANASFQGDNGDGIMFETFGEEVEYVRKVTREDACRVWTYVDGDEGTYLINGYHVVNRIGYFITEVPCVDVDDSEVIVSLDSEVL